MWVTTLLISPEKKGFFAQISPNLAFLVNLGLALPAHLVGDCGVRAVSRKTPIYFKYLMYLMYLMYLVNDKRYKRYMMSRHVSFVSYFILL